MCQHPRGARIRILVRIRSPRRLEATRSQEVHVSVVNEPQSRADPVSPELSAWIVAQRWYAGKGHEPQWERIGGFELTDARDLIADGADGPARIQVHLLLDHSGIPLLYQVPITVRAERVTSLDAAFITEIAGA